MFPRARGEYLHRWLSRNATKERVYRRDTSLTLIRSRFFFLSNVRSVSDDFPFVYRPRVLPLSSALFRVPPRFSAGHERTGETGKYVAESGKVVERKTPP